MATRRTFVGIIGLGAMGRPIAARILQAGFGVVGHTRSPATARTLIASGMTYAGSVAEVVEHAGIVLTALPDESAVEDVSAQVIAAALPGTCFVEHSTISPRLSKQVAVLAAASEMAYLEAPVSGGPEGAESGTLTVMAGGDTHVLKRVMPVLESYSSRITLCGPVGVGQSLKLINQLLVGIHTAAAAEAAALARYLEIDLAMVEDVVGSSFGASAMLGRTLPRVAVADFSPATPTSLIAKDLGLVRAAAAQVHAPLRLAEMAEKLYLEASASGYGDDDMAGLVRLWPQPDQ